MCFFLITTNQQLQHGNRRKQNFYHLFHPTIFLSSPLIQAWKLPPKGTVAQGPPPSRETKGQRRVAQLLWCNLWERAAVLAQACISRICWGMNTEHFPRIRTYERGLVRAPLGRLGRTSGGSRVGCTPLEAYQLRMWSQGTTWKSQCFAFLPVPKLPGQVPTFLSCCETAVNKEKVIGKTRGDKS